MIDLELAKQHCRVDDDDNDELLNVYIKAASAYCESYTGLVIDPRDKTFSFDCFGDCLPIPLRPVEAIINILYTDPDGNEQTLPAEDYRLVGENIHPALGKLFPSIAYPSKVMVTATLGSSDDEAQENITNAQLLLISHWYENREAVVVGTISGTLPFAVKALLDLNRDELH